MIVSIEGLDGVGKSTHAASLTERLRAKLWKFPVKDSPTGELIYGHLTGEWAAMQRNDADEFPTKAETKMNALVFQALQIANRIEALPQLMRDIAAGNVVFDRYWQSGYAYGRADGLDGEYLINLHSTLPAPNLNLLLDADVGTSFSRRPRRQDRYEECYQTLTAVCENYHALWNSKMSAEAQVPAHRWRIINARGTREETAAAIDREIAEWRDSVE